MLSKNWVSSTHSATLKIWWHLYPKITNLKKLKKSIIAEPQTHLYLSHHLVVGITIDSPTTTSTTTTPDGTPDRHLNHWNYE